MKKLWLLVVTLVMSCCAIIPAGCGGESIDKTKTQLYIYNYDGGVGTDWLYDLKASFETEFENISFESGKIGVQIIPSVGKDEGSTFTFKNSDADIVFTEKIPAYVFAQENLLDLSDVMQEILAQPGVSVSESVLQALTKEGNKIYGIPHYEGGGGIVYDKDLFNTKGFYIDKDGDYTNKSGDLSNGPDGIPDTPDDGLPATWEEFVELCKYMRKKGVAPFIISGEHKKSYISLIMDRIAASYDGLNATLANYCYDGTEIEYITSIIEDDSNLFGYDLTTDRANVTERNGYLLKQTKGKFYALAMVKEMIVNKWYSNSGWTSTVSHLDAQELYLKSFSSSEPIAMLIDGTWWENEATEVFERMSKTNTKYSKQNRNFGWMPLPTKLDNADGNINGDTLLTLDSLGACAMARGGISEDKEKLVKAFLKYCYSLENMKKFTLKTGCTRPFIFDMGDDIDGLTSFQKEMYNLHLQNKYIYVHSNNKMYSANETDLYSNRWRGKEYVNVIISFFERKISVKDYFQDMFVTKEYWETNSNYNIYFN